MNLQAYAQHRRDNGLRGATHVAVLQAIRDGRLTEPAAVFDGKRWRIDPALADQQWLANTSTRPSDVVRPPRVVSPPEPGAPAGPEDPVDPAEPAEPPRARPARRQRERAGDGPSKADAERAQAVYKAERLRIALLKDQDQVGSIADMQREARSIATAVRDALLNVADRLPPRLAPMNDVNEIRVLLIDEIELAMRMLNKK